MANKKYFDIFYLKYGVSFFVFLTCIFCHYNHFNVVYANNNIVPAVPFFPERYVYLPQSSNPLHQKIQKYILNDFKADGLNFLIGKPQNKADYRLIFNYAIGCPELGYSQECRLLVLWDLLRGDNAPVTSWQAYYPINIPIKKQMNRFKGYNFLQKQVAMVGDDFIKSLNYETLKKQDFDKVYVKPDRLSDKTTLCSADSIRQFYEEAGLYVTDTVHKARFLITTTVDSVEEKNDMIQININRMILDRLTGNHQIFPIKTTVEKDFLKNDSYNCEQSAGITMQNIGLFIDKAP